LRGKSEPQRACANLAHLQRDRGGGQL
jgi:hypothetical protein